MDYRILDVEHHWQGRSAWKSRDRLDLELTMSTDLDPVTLMVLLEALHPLRVREAHQGAAQLVVENVDPEDVGSTLRRVAAEVRNLPNMLTATQNENEKTEVAVDLQIQQGLGLAPHT